MHRIDTKTAQKDKFGAGKNGFTRGNPQTGTPATDLDDDYFDMLQEELCSVVEASGASLEKGRHDQLLREPALHRQRCLRRSACSLRSQRYKQNLQQTPLTIYAPVHRKASGHLLAFAPGAFWLFLRKGFCVVGCKMNRASASPELSGRAHCCHHPEAIHQSPPALPRCYGAAHKNYRSSCSPSRTFR